MPKYIVTARYVVEGTWTVLAEDKGEAHSKITNDSSVMCGTVSSNSLNVINWNMPMHPEEEILSIELAPDQSTTA